MLGLIGGIRFEALLLGSFEYLCAARRQRIDDFFSDFCAERKHGAKHFAERGKIIFGNPRAELQQMFGKHRLLIEDTQDGADRSRRTIFR